MKKLIVLFLILNCLSLLVVNAENVDEASTVDIIDVNVSRFWRTLFSKMHFSVWLKEKRLSVNVTHSSLNVTAKKISIEFYCPKDDTYLLTVTLALDNVKIDTLKSLIKGRIRDRIVKFDFSDIKKLKKHIVDFRYQLKKDKIVLYVLFTCKSGNFIIDPVVIACVPPPYSLHYPVQRKLFFAQDRAWALYTDISGGVDGVFIRSSSASSDYLTWENSIYAGDCDLRGYKVACWTNETHIHLARSHDKYLHYMIGRLYANGSIVGEGFGSAPPDPIVNFQPQIVSASKSVMPTNKLAFVDTVEDGDVNEWQPWTYDCLYADSSIVFQGNYSIRKDDYNDPYGGYREFDSFKSAPIQIEGWIYRPSSYSGGSADRISIEDCNQGNGYGFCVSHSANQVWIERRDSASATRISSIVSWDPPEDEWYHFVFRIDSDNSLTLEIYDINNNLNATVSCSDSTYSSFTGIVIRGGHEYYVDGLVAHGSIRMPNEVFVEALRVNMYTSDVNLEGDVTGNSTGDWSENPDGHVEMKDILLTTLHSGQDIYDSNWEPMADITQDGKVTAKDSMIPSDNYGNTGSYNYDFENITILFDTGETLHPDDFGWFWLADLESTPESFIVLKNNEPVIAQVYFYRFNNTASNVNICLDSNDYAYISFERHDHINNVKTPWLIKNAVKNGSWIEDWRYELTSYNSSHWMTCVLPLTDNKVIAIYSNRTVHSRVWNGSALSDEVVIEDLVLYDYFTFSAVSVNDTVHLVCFDNNNMIKHYMYNYSIDSWIFVANVTDALSYVTCPSLSLDNSNNLYCWWLDWTDNCLYYKRYSNNVWDTDATLFVQELNGFTFYFSLTSTLYADDGNRVGVLYQTEVVSPFCIRFVYLEAITEMWHTVESWFGNIVAMSFHLAESWIGTIYALMFNLVECWNGIINTVKLAVGFFSKSYFKYILFFGFVLLAVFLGEIYERRRR